MSTLTEEIKTLSAAEKAEIYYLLGQDEALNNYIFSNNKLFEEISLRDKAFAGGKIQLTTREQLTTRLKNRRGVL